MIVLFVSPISVSIVTLLLKKNLYEHASVVIRSFTPNCTCPVKCDSRPDRRWYGLPGGGFVMPESMAYFPAVRGTKSGGLRWLAMIAIRSGSGEPSGVLPTAV